MLETGPCPILESEFLPKPKKLNPKAQKSLTWELDASAFRVSVCVNMITYKYRLKN